MPFDTEASMSGVTKIVQELRRDPAVAAAGAVLGTSLYGRTPDTLVTLFGYGVEPQAQSLYELRAGRDLLPGDTTGVVLSETAAGLLRATVGDTVTLVGRLDPQVVSAAVGRRLVVRGLVRWLYDSRGQPSVGTLLPLMQRLARQPSTDRASIILVKAREDSVVPALAARLRARYPQLEVNSVADLVAQFRARLVYFRQLSYILGSMSLIVTVLLIGTLLTITVNERLGEIATLRAIGVSRATIVEQVLAEGSALTIVGATLGIVLGLVTARYLDAILTSFPGLPAAFSFFVPRADTLTFAALVLLVDRRARRALPGVAGRARTHRRHASRRGHVTPPLLARGLRKDYPMNGETVHALRGVSLQVEAGDYVGIVGPSGSGKSTLLQLLGGIDTPSAGTVEILGTRLDALSDRELTRLRLTRLGFIFQRFHLLPVLTARENVELPMAEAGVARADRRARARELLEYVGLGSRSDHRATQLSGGEMQRVAIARALANRPAVLLADEPTGELDAATGHEILELFRRLNADGTTLVVVTHDDRLAAEAGRIIRMLDGTIQD